MNKQLPPLKLVATYYDDYHHRQHFKRFDGKYHYCTVEIERGIFQLHSFVHEPECPLRTDVDIIEVDKQGNFVKQWQTATSEGG